MEIILAFTVGAIPQRGRRGGARPRPERHGPCSPQWKSPRKWTGRDTKATDVDEVRHDPAG